MPSLGFWNIKQKAIRRNMAAMLEKYGMTSLDAESIARKTFERYLTFQNASLDDIQESDYLDPEIMGLLPVTISYLRHLMEGRYEMARKAAWYDYVMIETARALAATFASVRKLPYNDLKDSMKMELSLYGIALKEWDILRSSELTKVNGLEYLTASKIQDKKLASSYSILLMRSSEDVVGASH